MKTPTLFDPKTQADKAVQILVDLASALEEFRTANPEKQRFVIDSLRCYVQVWNYVLYMVDKMEENRVCPSHECNQRPAIPEPRPEDCEQPMAQANKVANLFGEFALQLAVCRA